MITKKPEINYANVVNKLTQQRRTVGLLQFQYKDDDNISKWYSLTENLVIKAFGQKSNHLDQLQDLHGDILSSSDSDYMFDRKLSAKEAKEKLKNLLTVFIEELKMDMDSTPAPRATRSGTKNILIANQTVHVSVSIQQVIKHIKETEPDATRAAEAEAKLNELEKELKQESPAWAKVKDILKWLLDFGRDAFLAVLPVILEQYKK